MKTSLIPTLLLGLVALFLISCGSGEGSFSSADVKAQDSLLNIQASRLMLIQNTLEINAKALDMPFNGTEVTSEGVPIAPVKNPLEGLSDERMMSFKSGFNKVRTGLDGVKSQFDAVITEVTELQKLLFDAQAELKGAAVTPETKSAFTAVPDQIISLKSRIDSMEGQVKEAQKEALNLLMSEETLQHAASWLMVNSPMI